MARVREVGALLLAAAVVLADAEAAPTLESGRALLRKKDFAGAVRAFDAVVAREPENGIAWMLLGFSHHSLGDLDKALPALEKAAALPESAALGAYNAACVCALRGRKEAAFDWLARARRAGYANFEAIVADSDLAGLREDPRFDAYRPRAAESKEPFLEPVRILHDHFGEAAGDQFGWVARAAGDLDGDGATDYAVTAPFHGGAGAVYVYSGRGGKRLFKLAGDVRGGVFGWSVAAAGDVNGDGRADLCVCAPGANRVVFFSGADGAPLHTLRGEAAGDRFGQDARAVGDLDGDGRPEFLVGAPNHAGKGRAYLYSSLAWKRLGVMDGENAGDQFGGGGVAGAGGLLVVSAVQAGTARRGRVYGFAYPGFERRFVVSGGARAKNLGWFLSTPADFDGDGVTDVYATDWHDSRGTGAAFVFSGADGKALLELRGAVRGEGFGIGVGGAGDLDGDGTPDLVVGAWINRETGKQAGKIYLHSGQDGALFATVTGAIPGDVLGFDATGIGDVDGDGVPDLLVTSAYNAARGAKAGRAYVLSGASCLRR